MKNIQNHFSSWVVDSAAAAGENILIIFISSQNNPLS